MNQVDLAQLGRMERARYGRDAPQTTSPRNRHFVSIRIVMAFRFPTTTCSTIWTVERRNVVARAGPSEDDLMIFQRLLLGVLCVVVATMLPASEALSQEDAEAVEQSYTIQPGDKLQISVWNEPDLQEEVLIAPDGGIAFPLVGEMSAIGKSVVELREDISERLSKYISEPIVTVTIREVLGNKIYVIGQVNRPGQFVVNPMVDVIQALSIAGGTTPYASLNNISILRRHGSQQTSIPFKYGDISSGKNLDTNIILQSGDVVIVP